MPMGSAIERVTVFEKGPEGRLAPVVVYRTRGRRSDNPVSKLEQMFRRVATAQAAAASTYLARHDRSNGRKRDGWLKEMGENLYKAVKTGKQTYDRSGE